MKNLNNQLVDGGSKQAGSIRNYSVYPDNRNITSLYSGYGIGRVVTNEPVEVELEFVRNIFYNSMYVHFGPGHFLLELGIKGTQLSTFCEKANLFEK